MPQDFNAIVGATLIDGIGGPPAPDSTILIEGQRIAAVGPSSEVAVPVGAAIIDGSGRSGAPDGRQNTQQAKQHCGRHYAEPARRANPKHDTEPLCAGSGVI